MPHPSSDTQGSAFSWFANTGLFSSNLSPSSKSARGLGSDVGVSVGIGLCDCCGVAVLIAGTVDSGAGVSPGKKVLPAGVGVSPVRGLGASGGGVGAPVARYGIGDGGTAATEGSPEVGIGQNRYRRAPVPL